MSNSLNHIHFIWLGSMLRDTDAHPHQSRLREWQRKNPRHTIQLWFSRCALLSKPEEYEALQHFCVNAGITPGDIDSLPMKKPVRDFMVRCMQDDAPNWGAISDLLRFYVLKTGGFYFDTDIITSEETSELYDLELPFGFALHLRAPTRTSFALSGLDEHDFKVLKTYEISEVLLNGAAADNYTEIEFEGEDSYKLYNALSNADSILKDKIIPPARFYYSPDMIAAVSSSEFITKCIALIEAMIFSPQIEAIYEQLHHPDSEKRRLATCYTTGEIAFAACLQLKNRVSQPFISFDLKAEVDDRIKISNMDDFNDISIHHICKHVGLHSLNERSYMIQEERQDLVLPKFSWYTQFLIQISTYACDVFWVLVQHIFQNHRNSEKADLSDDGSYEDQILHLFYRSIQNNNTMFFRRLFDFWSQPTIDQEQSISQSLVSLK